MSEQEKSHTDSAWITCLLPARPVSRVFQGASQMFHGCFKAFSSLFPGCFRGVLSMFKCVSRVFQGVCEEGYNVLSIFNE